SSSRLKTSSARAPASNPVSPNLQSQISNLQSASPNPATLARSASEGNTPSPPADATVTNDPSAATPSVSPSLRPSLSSPWLLDLHEISTVLTDCCRRVDPQSTDKMLEEAEEDEL